MKQIIIFLLIIILAIMGYNQYKKYKRFSLAEYGYQAPDAIDINYWDQDYLYRYYESIERLNGYVITQWSTRGIDVRNPKKDNDETRAAVQEYSELKARVKFYEGRLVESTRIKQEEGLGNEEIQMLYEGRIEINKIEDPLIRKINLLSKMFDDLNNHELRPGSRNALVFELQKVLVDKGYDIPTDGIYRIETTNAVMQFEEKNGLFADGVIDRLTFEKLIR